MSDHEKRYFWLRLKRDFFKRHDIRILESMENGKEYVLFYLKLLTESIDHEGELRFSDKIPYTREMLATITNTSPEIADCALDALFELDMIHISDDGTYILTGIDNMIGTAEQDEHTRESTRLRVKAYRERQKEKNNVVTLQDRYSNVTCNGEKELEKEKEKEKECISAPKEQKRTHGAYKHVKLKDSELEKLKTEFGDQITEECITFLDEHIEMKGYKAKSHYLCIKRWVVDAVRERRAKKAGYGKKTVNNQYAQRDIDFDKLEKELLSM